MSGSFQRVITSIVNCSDYLNRTINHFLIMLCQRIAINRVASLRHSFTDYYIGVPQTIIEGLTVQRPDTTNIMFTNNIFENFVGCAIFFSSYAPTSLLVENCMFYNCSSGENGGALSISLYQGSCILNKICSSNCITNKIGHFAYLSASGRNEQYLISVSYSSLQLANGTASICLEQGDIKSRLLNSSYNNGKDASALLIILPKSLDVQFISIINNYGFGSIFKTQLASNSNNVSSSNFCNNSAGNVYGILSFSWNIGSRHITFKEDVFDNNKGTLFANVPYGGNSNFIYISNCWIIHNIYSYSLTSGNYISNGSPISYTSTYALLHYASFYCDTPQSQIGADVTPCPSVPAPPTECVFVQSKEGEYSLVHFVLQLAFLIIQ